MDCIEFLKKLPDNSVDSCVTDPPYGLEFMGKDWDKVGTAIEYQHWCMEWAVEVFRVLKHGAHLLAFSGTRTYHRLACAIEDAGFEIRDQIHWLYGSGFPKGMNVSKAIDKSLGVYEDAPEIPLEQFPERMKRAKTPKMDITSGGFHTTIDVTDREKRKQAYTHVEKRTVSEEAKQWMGWNTQLKPSHEPIVLARKPISEKSIVENVLRHGTGAINIDACRIAVSPDVDTIGRQAKRKDRTKPQDVWFAHNNPENLMAGVLPTGRYPANLILSHHPDCKLIQRGRTEVRHTERAAIETTGKGIYSDGWVRNPDEYSFDAGEPEVWACVEGCPVRTLNKQSGTSKSSKRMGRIGKSLGLYDDDSWEPKTDTVGQWHGDSGGAARFFFTTQMDFEREIVPYFYCPKPSVKERSAGLKDKRNIHITVKPVQIMRWLVRLITPRGGVVLDCFLGSGTTAIAAENERCDWLGCDNNEEYCKIAEARIEALGGTQTTITDFEE